MTTIDFRRTLVSAIGALILGIGCIAAAVGPANAWAFQPTTSTQA